MRAVLLNEAGDAIDPLTDPWAKPAYFSANSISPDPTQVSVTRNGYGYFYNLPPGDHLIRLEPPAGASSLPCSLDPNGDGHRTGALAAEPAADNTYRVRARAGFNNFVLRAFYSVN